MRFAHLILILTLWFVCASWGDVPKTVEEIDHWKADRIDYLKRCERGSIESSGWILTAFSGGRGHDSYDRDDEISMTVSLINVHFENQPAKLPEIELHPWIEIRSVNENDTRVTVVPFECQSGWVGGVSDNFAFPWRLSSHVSIQSAFANLNDGLYDIVAVWPEGKDRLVLTTQPIRIEIAEVTLEQAKAAMPVNPNHEIKIVEDENGKEFRLVNGSDRTISFMVSCANLPHDVQERGDIHPEECKNFWPFTMNYFFKPSGWQGRLGQRNCTGGLRAIVLPGESKPLNVQRPFVRMSQDIWRFSIRYRFENEENNEEAFEISSEPMILGLIKPSENVPTR